MSETVVFLIRPLSLESGFELSSGGVMEAPLRVERLFEAVVIATQMGQGLDFEIQILDVAGEVAELLELRRPWVGRMAAVQSERRRLGR